MKDLLLSIRVGYFLATRDIKNNNKWTTILIIFIMTLTFLNLIVARGVLVGLTKGASDAFRKLGTGDVQVSALDENEYVEDSPRVISIIENLDQVEVASPRYKTRAVVEANYKDRTSDDKSPNTVPVNLAGINPEKENKLNNLSDLVIEGEFLNNNDIDYIIVDRTLLKEFNIEQEGLENIHPGSKVRLTVGNNIREVTVKGITKAKSIAGQDTIYMNDYVVQQLIDRKDFGRDEISIKLKEGVDPEAFKTTLIANDIDKSGKIRYWLEAQPKFLKDITATFSIIGNLIGTIALVVAAITIFIIIFVNAITRRRYIGIMKGIGINSQAIIISYVFQAIFYAVIGISIAMIIIYTLLIPYIAKNPIDFPFSDGVIVAEAGGTSIRAFLMVLATVIAGVIPARMIVNKNTLDSILGR